MTSTELIDTIILKLDRDKLPLALFLDISKAFDTLNNKVSFTTYFFMANRLNNFTFFKSYLNNYL